MSHVNTDKKELAICVAIHFQQVGHHNSCTHSPMNFPRKTIIQSSTYISLSPCYPLYPTWEIMFIHFPLLSSTPKVTAMVLMAVLSIVKSTYLVSLDCCLLQCQLLSGWNLSTCVTWYNLLSLPIEVDLFADYSIIGRQLCILFC